LTPVSSASEVTTLIRRCRNLISLIGFHFHHALRVAAPVPKIRRT